MDQPSATRILDFWLRRPRWVHTLVSVLLALILIGLAVLIAVPAFIIGACVVGVFLIVVGVRSLILRIKEGPRTSTMRQNVRVIVRRDV